jgi:thiol-disulfide isomerase/thioredoxin
MTKTGMRWLKIVLVALAAGAVVAATGDLVRTVAPKEKANFTGTTLEGQPWALAEHRGKRPIILSFFGTWCGPCRMELPHLMEMQRKYRDRGLQVVLLTEEPSDAVRRDQEFGSSGLTFLVEASPVFRSYEVSGVPRLIYFDPSGEVARDVEGFSPEDMKSLDQRLAQLPAAPTAEANQPETRRNG